MIQRKKLKLKLEDAKEHIQFYDIKEKREIIISISDLYKKQKDTFEEWWKDKYNEFSRNNCIVYARHPKSKKQKLKYIAKLNKKEFKIFEKEVSEKILELKAAIPVQYNYAFEIEKDFEYIDTAVASVSVTDEYTTRCRKANKRQIKSYLSKCYDFKHRDMQETFEKVILDEELKILEDNFLYDMKEITAERIMLNYFDEKEEKSGQKKVVDVVFVPEKAKIYKKPPKKRAQRREKREGFEEVELLHRTFYFFKKEMVENEAVD